MTAARKPKTAAKSPAAKATRRTPAPTPLVTLSPPVSVPLDKLNLSDRNVRRIKNGITIAALADDIAQRTLLQSLSVRANVDDQGQPDSTYAVQAGGRRLAALCLLVKQKRLAADAPIPCIVRSDGVAEEDSLAENHYREALHPLDEFRAFQTLADLGTPVTDIAARFHVSDLVVRQRLKLATVSPALLQVYAADEMTLEQLMAFTVSDAHARQEQVWQSLSGYHREPYQIRRRLTENTVATADKRMLFVGQEAFEAAGGHIVRDLFQFGGCNGTTHDVALLDRLAADKLAALAEEVRREGWKWVTPLPSLPYSESGRHTRLVPTTVDLGKTDQARRERLEAELDALESADDMPDDCDDAACGACGQRAAGVSDAQTQQDVRDARIAALNREIDGLEAKRLVYDADERARAGVFVTIDDDGFAVIQRGFVRPEDGLPPPDADTPDVDGVLPDRDGDGQVIVGYVGDSPASGQRAAGVSDAATQDDDADRPLSEKLLGELTTDHTVALRAALAQNFAVAFRAALHALCLATVYRRTPTTLELSVRPIAWPHTPPGLEDRPYAKAMAEADAYWRLRLPKDAADLWSYLGDIDAARAQELFAYCTALTVNAVHVPYNRNRERLDHAQALATALDLDMAAAGWTPTAESYFGRVAKSAIFAAVREAKDDRHADLLADLKKTEMATEATRMLEGSGWLPDILRTHQAKHVQSIAAPEAGGRLPAGEAPATINDLPDFLQDGDAA